ncbi:MAG: metal-dependent hydrolase [Methanoregula sp.]|jgi:membrane-bound metal-dependent hydrolase YbcI (DUF457 family)
MITRHHIALTILCALILCSALVPSDLVLMTVICAGACIGTLLPDIQMKKPKGTQIRTVAWLVSRLTRIVFTPLICRLYHALGERTCDPEEKRLTHSVPGILFLWAVMATLLVVPAFLITSAALGLSAAFLCGVMLGLVLHLIEDMCTRKGITPLFPFSTTRVSGSIRPCNTTDRRIAQFHFYHCSVTGIILGFQYLGSWQGIASVPLCLFGLGSCLGMMIWSSDVSISYDAIGNLVNEQRTPVLSDPFIAQWKAGHLSQGLMMGVYYFNKNEQ